MATNDDFDDFPKLELVGSPEWKARMEREQPGFEERRKQAWIDRADDWRKDEEAIIKDWCAVPKHKGSPDCDPKAIEEHLASFDRDQRQRIDAMGGKRPTAPASAEAAPSAPAAPAPSGGNVDQEIDRWRRDSSWSGWNGPSQNPDLDAQKNQPWQFGNPAPTTPPTFGNDGAGRSTK